MAEKDTKPLSYSLKKPSTLVQIHTQFMLRFTCLFGLQYTDLNSMYFFVNYNEYLCGLFIIVTRTVDKNEDVLRYVLVIG